MAGKKEEAVRRLGAFTRGHRVIYTPDEPFDDEGLAEVTDAADDEGWIYIRFEEIVWSDGAPVFRYALPRQLRHAP